MPPRGKRLSKRASSRRLRKDSIELTYEASIVERNDLSIDSWKQDDIRGSLDDPSEARYDDLTIGDYVHEQLMEDRLYDFKPEQVQVLKVGITVAYSCSHKGCHNQVKFLVDNKHMCQSHMIEEVSTGENPQVFPSERGEFKPYDLNALLSTIIPPAQSEEEESSDPDEAGLAIAKLGTEQ